MEEIDLHKIEEQVLQLGIWKSLEELEDSISIDELHRFYITKQREDYEQKRFMAAMQGVKMEEFIDPDEAAEKKDFESIKKRAEIKRRLIMQGKDPNDYANIEEMEADSDLAGLEEAGFGVEWE